MNKYNILKQIIEAYMLHCNIFELYVIGHCYLPTIVNPRL